VWWFMICVLEPWGSILLDGYILAMSHLTLGERLAYPPFSHGFRHLYGLFDGVWTWFRLLV
jgi:hypothetical protein